MRKNKMLRMASALLILVLLTTSVVGGTFAKYTTQSTALDTAQVARWGVTFEATTNLFARSYKDVAVTDNTATVHVDTNGQNLVAPGTKGTGLGIKTTSLAANITPQVSYQVTIKLGDDAKMPTLTYTQTGETTEKTYEPVKFSVSNGSTVIRDGLGLSDLKTLFNGTNAIYQYDVHANKYYVDSNLNGMIDASEKTNALTDAPKIKIGWEWVYEDTTNTNNNTLDTALGNIAAGNINPPTGITYSSNNVDVSLPWTMTATQID